MKKLIGTVMAEGLIPENCDVEEAALDLARYQSVGRRGTDGGIDKAEAQYAANRCQLVLTYLVDNGFDVPTLKTAPVLLRDAMEQDTTRTASLRRRKMRQPHMVAPLKAALWSAQKIPGRRSAVSPSAVRESIRWTSR